MALAFGSVFTMLVRRFVGADEVEGYDLGKIRARIKGKVMIARDRFRTRPRATQHAGDADSESIRREGDAAPLAGHANGDAARPEGEDKKTQ